MLAVLTMLGAGSATVHKHPGGSDAEQSGLLSHVPISVIANPDAPSAVVHLHAGSTEPSEPCAACALSNARGEVAGETAPTPAAPCIHIAVVAMLAPAT